MLTWSTIRRRRLARHQLSRPGRDVVEAASAVGTVHAQVQHAAELSLALRVRGGTRDLVRRRLREGDLVRTYGLRGTIHLVPAAELDLWLTALRSLPRPSRAADQFQQLDESRRRELVEAVAAAVSAADPLVGLDRSGLAEVVPARLGPWARAASVPAFGSFEPLWTVGIGAAAAEGRLLLGRNESGRTTYLPRPSRPVTVDPQLAVAEVTRRFLHVFGPATHQDHARWFRTTPVAARGALRAAAVAVDLEGGGRAWVLPGDETRCDAPDADDGLAAGVHLLPHFDPYLVGTRPREQLVPPQHAQRLLRSGASGPVPALVVDGVAVGVWTRAERAGREIVTVEPFVPLTRPQLADLEAAAARIGAAAGRSADLVVGPVDARPHL